MSNDIVIKPRISEPSNNPIIEFTGSSGGIAQVEVTPTGDLQISSSISTAFITPTSHNAGLSGSLTQLTDGTSYLVAGTGIEIVSASNGNVTISSTSVTTPGSPDTAIQFNNSGLFDGDANFTFANNTIYLTGSLANGIGSKAIGSNSHAEGQFTIAYGIGSHSEGQNTTAGIERNGIIYSSPNNAHAEGRDTNAAGEQSHTEGDTTLAYGDNSHAEGSQTSTGYVSITGGLINDTLTLDGDFSNLFDGATYQIWISGGATNSLLENSISSIASYNIGTNQTTVTLDNATSISSMVLIINRGSGDFIWIEAGANWGGGFASHAEGVITRAQGYSSHAEGFRSIATGEGSHAEGRETLAYGEYSHAEGKWNEARGPYSHVEGFLSIAAGEASHAEGSGSIATGIGSHAEGNLSSAPGDYSHAEGWATITSGSWSHAEGNATITSGSWSHAEGIYTIARGLGSHAEGSGSLATGAGSHAEGKDTTSLGDFSHAAGLATLASGYASFAIGSGSVAAGNFSFAAGEYVIASGSNQTVVGKWNKQLNADSLFVVGNGDSNSTRSDILLVNSGSVMVCSAAMAPDTIFYVGTKGTATNALFEGNIVASGTLDVKEGSQFFGATKHIDGLSGSLQSLIDGSPYLIAGTGITISTGSSPEGQITISSTVNVSPASPDTAIQFNDAGSFGGDASLTFKSGKLYLTGTFAQGEENVALGNGSHAEGYATTAEANYSHAEGKGTITAFWYNPDISNYSGEYSHAEGYETITSGSWAHSEGEGTKAIKDGSHSEGYWSIAFGPWSHAEGNFSTTTGSWSHAEGSYTIARGEASHAEGSGSLASGLASHAEGKNTIASGEYSHASGLSTLAKGMASLAVGSGSSAVGNFSFAGGAQTIASGTNQTVIGKWNKTLNTDSLFVIGNGNSNASRNDIFIVNSGSVMIESSSLASDTIFYVGTSGLATNSRFDGNVVVSGTLDVKDDALFSGGMSGSLQRLIDGNAYLNAGAGITISTGSSPVGQITITSTITQTNPASPSDSIQYNSGGNFGGSSNLTFASNTLYLTGSLSNGDSSDAIGEWSHAEGFDTTTIGQYSHAEGSATTAEGKWSHAEGGGTTAEGKLSHAEGVGSKAIGDGSHAEGWYTHATGSYSLSAGLATIASGSGQVVVGKYNKRDNADSLFIIGNGASNVSRSDILLVNNTHVMIGSGSVDPGVFLRVGSNGSRNTTVFEVDAVVSGTLKTDVIVETTGPMGTGDASARKPRQIPIAINNYPGSNFPVTESLVTSVETTIGPPIYIESNTLFPGDIISIFSTIKKDTYIGTGAIYQSRVEISNTYDSTAGSTVAYKQGYFDTLDAAIHRINLMVCSTGSSGILTGISDSTDNDNNPTLGTEVGRYNRIQLDTTSDIYIQQTFEVGVGLSAGTQKVTLEYISGYINDPVKSR